MARQLLLGSMLGGLVLFAWGAISWMVLPWHEQTLEAFSDEPAVAAAISAHALRDGIYILPNPHRHPDNTGEKQKQAREKDALQRMKQGPFVFLAVTRAGSDPDNPAPFLRSILVQIVIAGLVTGLVIISHIGSFSLKVIFISALGLLGGLMVYVPLWNWWTFSSSFTLTGMADLVISFFFAGLVIATITRH